MKYTKKKEPTQRQLRISETIRHALSWVFKRDIVYDPEIAGRSLTVTEVRLSSDLKNAKIFVLPLGGEGSDSLVLALNRAAPFLLHKISSQLRLKSLPKLTFVLDSSFDQARHIDELLSKIESPRTINDHER